MSCGHVSVLCLLIFVEDWYSKWWLHIWWLQVHLTKLLSPSWETRCQMAILLQYWRVSSGVPLDPVSLASNRRINFVMTNLVESLYVDVCLLGQCTWSRRGIIVFCLDVLIHYCHKYQSLPCFTYWWDNFQILWTSCMHILMSYSLAWGFIPWMAIVGFQRSVML